MTNNTKIWSTMTKEEKTTRLFAMKAEGYTNKEIGEYYGVSEDAIKKTLQRSQKGTKRTLEEINDTPVKVEITMDTISPFLGQLLERIESLELEVASVKKLQVENAAIERLDDTEYKFFVKNRKTNEEFKFRDAIELATFVSEFKGCKFTDKFFVDSTGILKPNASDIYPLLITQCFKNDNDNMSRELETWKIEGKLLQNELENIKSNL